MRPAIVLLGIAIAGRPAGGQVSRPDPLLRGSLPPIRSAPAPQWTSQAFGRSVEIRALSDGRVLINDIDASSLRVLNEQLLPGPVVFDRSSPAPLTYPQASARMVAGRGDTTLFLDLPSRGFRVIAPDGKIVRRLSLVDGAEASAMSSRAVPVWVDRRGLIFFTGLIRVGQPAPGVQQMADSSMIVRLDAARRGRDTLAYVMGRPNIFRVSSPASPAPGASGPPQTATVVVPVFDVGDAWTITSGGSVAIVRATDFHIDWIDPNGSRRTTPAIPIPVHKLTAAEKQTLLDAARASLAGGSNRVTGPGGAPAPFQITPEVSPDVPDVEPAFVPMSAVPDLDNHVWLLLGVRSAGRIAGPSTYAVIDTAGRIIDRVAFPMGRLIRSFGPRGAVYLASSTPAGIIIEKVILPRR
jgi:hypothetical protein